MAATGGSKSLDFADALGAFLHYPPKDNFGALAEMLRRRFYW